MSFLNYTDLRNTIKSHEFTMAEATSLIRLIIERIRS